MSTRSICVRWMAARLAPALVAATAACAAPNSSGTGSVGSPQVEPAVDDAAIYRDRFARFMADPGNWAYGPMEPLPGSPRWRPLPGSAISSIEPQALERARRYAETMRSSAFIVWRDGKVETAWYARGMDATTPMVSKSLSKPLAAIAVGRAIALGAIRSLDQPIADFIPELKGTQKGRILVRHLLDMRSGMLHQGVSTDPDHPMNRAYLSTDHGRAIVEDYPMIGEPGSLYSYANAPADLVALVIERATGRRYVEFVSREILIPLGARGGEIWVNRPGGLAHSGCCTMLPAETYLRLAILLLDDGRWHGRHLLPSGYVAQMRKGTPQNPSFGLGIWIGEPYRQRRPFGAAGQPGPAVLHSEPYLDRELFLFDGNANQIVQVSPANRLIVLRMGPTPPAPSAANPAEWDNSFLVNTLIRGLRPAPSPRNERTVR